MSEVVRKNLGVMLSDVVTISPVYRCEQEMCEFPCGMAVYIIPLIHTVEGVSGNLLNDYRKPSTSVRHTVQ